MTLTAITTSWGDQSAGSGLSMKFAQIFCDLGLRTYLSFTELCWTGIPEKLQHTVDGRNPAPSDM